MFDHVTKHGFPGVGVLIVKSYLKEGFGPSAWKVCDRLPRPLGSVAIEGVEGDEDTMK